MKNTLCMLLAVLPITVTTAQERKSANRDNDRMEKFKDFSPEEIAQLKTKKLTLELDLNTDQQQKIKAFVLKEVTTKKAKREERKKQKETNKDEKPSKEERLTMINKHLDEKIAAKAAMKNILNDEQFAKLEKIESRKTMKKRRSHKERVKRKK